MTGDRVGELIAAGLDRAAAELAVRETLAADVEEANVEPDPQEQEGCP
jgi:hypothetical protein